MDEFKTIKDDEGEFYMKGDKRALKVERVLLPDHDEENLSDQDDIVVWTKFNILLQAVDELTQEYGHAGDATRQLRVITEEVIRRNMFSFSVFEREPTDEQLWTWYDVMKQFIEGANNGKWQHIKGDGRQYTEIVKELKARGHEMPKQQTRVDPLLVSGRLIA